MSGRKLMLAGLALWLIAAVAAFLSWRYLYNVLCGPFPIESSSLAALTDIGSRQEYFVTFEPDDVKHLFPYAHSGGQEPYSVYALLNVSDRKLLARLPLNHGRSASGTLEELSSFEKKHVLDPLTAHGAEAHLFKPFRLNGTRYFRTTGYLLAVLPLAAILGLGSCLLIVGIRRR